MPRKSLMKGVRRIVVKIGSSSLTCKGVLSGRKISSLVTDVAGLVERGYQVLIVSSGAISAGAGLVGKSMRHLTIPEKQAMAAVGQTILMNEYRNKFNRRGIRVGQVLLTEDDVRHRTRFLNARHTLEALLKLGIVPIVNENDTVAVNEIRFGDNDMLSAHVASLVHANLLVLLTDIDGFYMHLDDPSPVEEVRVIDDDILRRAGGAGTAYGTGGMLSKVKAARIMMQFGERMIIAPSRRKFVLNRIMDGEVIGTLFVGRDRQLSGRKRWLALRKSVGIIHLDHGAVNAICEGKKSLLASGITGIEGSFSMGDIVDLSDPDGILIGKGITNYGCNELMLIKGKKSAEIKKILGENIFGETINRDNMIVY